MNIILDLDLNMSMKIIIKYIKKISHMVLGQFPEIVNWHVYVLGGMGVYGYTCEDIEFSV